MLNTNFSACMEQKLEYGEFGEMLYNKKHNL